MVVAPTPAASAEDVAATMVLTPTVAAYVTLASLLSPLIVALRYML